MDDASNIGEFIRRRVVRRGSSPRRRSRSSACYDRDGRILLFNEACERATGFTREEVLGRDARDFVIPPEEREAFGEFLAYVWKTGTPSPQVGHWQTKDGGRRLIAWSNRPMAGADGAPVVARHDRDRPDRPRSARDEDDRALQGDPEAKLAEVSPARHRAARAAARRDARRLGGQPRARLHGGLGGVRAGAAGQRVGRLALRGRRHGDDRRAPQPRQHRRASTSASACRPRSTRRSARVLRDRRARADRRLGRRSAAARSPRRSSASATARPPPRRSSSPARCGARSRSPARTRCRRDSEDRLGAFCELVSLAVASAQARADLIASRARLVEAGDEQRRRLERNLHDGAQQRLVSVALKLRLARAQLERRARGHGATCSTTRCASSTPACEELREIARGLHPAILGEHGPAAARWTRWPSGSRSPVEHRRRPTSALPEHVEATAYYIVSEALTNVAKHAAADQRARVGPRATATCCAARSPTTAAAAPTPSSGDRHPRPARPRRGRGRDAHGGQPAGPRDGRHGRAAARRRRVVVS